MAQGDDSSFFEETKVTVTPRLWSKFEIIDRIKERQHIKFAELRRLSGWKPTTLRDFLRGLELSGLVLTRIILDDRSTAQKVISWNDKGLIR